MKIFLCAAGYGLLQVILLTFLARSVTKQRKLFVLLCIVLKAVLYGVGIKLLIDRFLSQLILCFCGYLFAESVFLVFYFLYLSFVRGKEKKIVVSVGSFFCCLARKTVEIFKKAVRKKA